jgi:hypothetical protein
MEVSFRGQQYRLRAGTPMPTMQAGRFVYHTFMAEVSDVDFISCTDTLPGSEEFRGQGGNLCRLTFHGSILKVETCLVVRRCTPRLMWMRMISNGIYRLYIIEFEL